MGRYRAFIQIGLACAALVGAGVSWSKAHHMVGVAPIADGQPATTSLVYDPQLLLVALLLLTTAGVLAVVGTARLLKTRTGAKPSF